MTTATKFYTWNEIWGEVADVADIEDQDFIDQDEAMIHANRAIDEAEALIHKMHEGYFRDSDGITLVSGTDEYALPSRIYAHKIEKIIYRNGTRCYEITSLKWQSALLKYQQAIAAGRTSSNDEMEYFIKNTTAGSPKIVFTPPVDESGAYVTVWFYRNANRFTTGTDVCDIPEFATFVKAYLLEWVYWKIAAGSPRHVTAQDETKNQRGLMMTTLKDMIPDGNDALEPDLSHYEEHN